MLDDDVQQDSKPEAGFRAGVIKPEDPKPDTEQPKPESAQPNPKELNSADQTRERIGSDYPTNVAPKSSDKSSSSENNPLVPSDNPSTDPSNPEPDKKYAKYQIQKSLDGNAYVT